MVKDFCKKRVSRLLVKRLPGRHPPFCCGSIQKAPEVSRAKQRVVSGSRFPLIGVRGLDLCVFFVFPEGKEVEEFTVLLVDDEVEFLDVLVKRLRKRKLSLLSASNGEEALRLVRDHPVDVAVLDVKMPGMDGISVLKEIKKINPSIEVIMLTGHANVEVALEGMELGAFDYLMKPVDFDELLYKLQDAYKKRTLQQKKEPPGS